MLVGKMALVIGTDSCEIVFYLVSQSTHCIISGKMKKLFMPDTLKMKRLFGLFQAYLI